VQKKSAIKYFESKSMLADKIGALKLNVRFPLDDITGRLADSIVIGVPKSDGKIDS
jgi:hypothetical protein